MKNSNILYVGIENNRGFTLRTRLQLMIAFVLCGETARQFKVGLATPPSPNHQPSDDDVFTIEEMKGIRISIYSAKCSVDARRL